MWGSELSLSHLLYNYPYFTTMAHCFTPSGSIFMCVRSFTRSDTCCNPSMLQMHLPHHPMGNLTMKDDWEGCVTTGTPETQSPEPEHMAPAVMIEPHGIRPSQITGFVWFRLTWVVLQVVLTLKALVMRSHINLNTPQGSPDPKKLEVRLPAKQWLNFELEVTVYWGKWCQIVISIHYRNVQNVCLMTHFQYLPSHYYSYSQAIKHNSLSIM